MRTSFLLVTLAFLACSCNNTGQGNIQHLDTKSDGDTGTVIKTAFTLDTLPNISVGKMTLVSSGQMSPYTKVIIDGSNFDLVSKDNHTTYLATKDKRFQTPEGYKVWNKAFRDFK